VESHLMPIELWSTKSDFSALAICQSICHSRQFVLPQSELEFPFAGVSITTGEGETHEVPGERLVAA
jgi:hypothetical protein